VPEFFYYESFDKICQVPGSRLGQFFSNFLEIFMFFADRAFFYAFFFISGRRLKKMSVAELVQTSRSVWVWFLFFSFFLNTLYAQTGLTILHSNDHHGQLLPNGELGGMARFATLVNQIRDEAQRNGNFVLLLDAGDVNSGTPESDLFQAKPDFLVMNYLKYDYAAFGNHEFDPPFQKLQDQIRLARFPMGAANVFGEDGKPLGTPFRVFDFPNCRVAVFGITLSNYSILPKPEGKFLIKDEVETARQMVRFLRGEKKADLVIAVTHLGFILTPGAKVTSEQFAEAVPGIDLIVDGHSHSKMEKPRSVHGTPVVSANERSRFLGEARSLWEQGKIAEFSWKCHPVTRDIPEDPEVKRILAPFIEATARKMNQIVMRTTAPFPGGTVCRTRQTALGQFIADGVVQTLEKNGISCDFSFINGGNIRAGIPEGEVSRGNWFSVLPFKNEIHVLELDGQTLRELFEFIASLPDGTAAYPQLSSQVQCVLENGKDGKKRVRKLTINGEEVDSERQYFLAVTDFIASGGDKYDVLLKRRSVKKTGLFLQNLIVEYVQTLSEPLAPKVEERLRVE